MPRPERELHIGGGTNTEQTARMLAALGPLLADERPDARARLRRHELDARRRPGGRAGPRAGRARRGGDALVRPAHARGAQPRPHRPPRPTCCCARRRRRSRTSRARVGRGPRRAGRRRHGRRRAAVPAARAGPTSARCATRASRPGEFVLATAHRAGNVDDPERLRALVDLLLGASTRRSCCPLHPRTRARLDAAGWLDELQAAPHVSLTPPLGYMAFTVAADQRAARCSPTPAACRRRPTWPACRA